MSTGRGDSNNNNNNSSLQAAASGRGRGNSNNNYNRSAGGGGYHQHHAGMGRGGGGGGRGGGMWQPPPAAAAGASGMPTAMATTTNPSMVTQGGGGGAAAGNNSSPHTIPSSIPPPPQQQQHQQQQPMMPPPGGGGGGGGGYYHHAPQHGPPNPYGMHHPSPHISMMAPLPPGVAAGQHNMRYGMPLHPPPPNQMGGNAGRTPYGGGMQPMNYQGVGAAGMRHYPPPPMGMSGSGAPPVPAPRKVLSITDKSGKPIDISKAKPSSSSSSTTTNTTTNETAPPNDGTLASAATSATAAAAALVAKAEGGNDAAARTVEVASLTAKMSSLQVAATSSSKSSEAGAALRRAAEEAIAAGSAKKAREEAEKKQRLKELEQKQAEELRLAMERKMEEERRAQEESARLAKETREREEREQRAEAEARARKEAEERARKEAEERARKEAEERQRKEEDEKAARETAEAEARAKLLVSSQAAAAPTLAATAVSENGGSGITGGDKDELSRSGSSSSGGGGAKATSPNPWVSGFRPGGFRPGATRSTGGLRPGSASSITSSTGNAAMPSETTSTAAAVAGGRNGDSNVSGGSAAAGEGNGLSASAARRPFIYSKQMLLSLKDEDYCVCKPEDLPDLTVRSGGGGGLRRQSSGRGNYGANRDGGGGGGGGGNQGDDWSRGKEMSTPGGGGNRFRGSAVGGGGERVGGGGGGDWDRGRAPPPQRGGRGGGPEQHHQPYPDQEIFTPLVRTENRWMPSKDNSAMAKVEKQVKSLLNKMSKEKFDKLSAQMCDIPILSYEMLTTVIKLVYEKAISEPSFSDMYASLCYRLSQVVKKGAFIKIIESDEDPSAEPGAEVDYSVEGSGSVSFRWSNDVSTSDAEIVGPFEDDKRCIDVALSKEDTVPVTRGEMELTLHRLLVKRGTFIKIMHSSLDDKYYTVYFPISKAMECGQQLSLEIFTSEIEAQSHATKMNTFKRSLLNKCEDEFNKQDIYTDWKAEKKEYDKSKASLTEKEKAEKEAELEFRRMKIKKQMLGNIKFIGELFKLGMLKEKIMRFCIHHLLKLQEEAGGLRSHAGEDGVMDEEDHEALINLFKTIGEKIDNAKAQPYMTFYFRKIQQLSEDTTLSSRLRFAYSDLIDMRANGWKLRREVETAKSLDEIRKDAEREERMAQMQSQQGGGGGARDAGRGGQRGHRDDNRTYDNRGSDRNVSYDNRGQDGGRGGGRGYDGGRGAGRGGNDRDSFRGRDGGRGDRDNNRGYETRGPDRNVGFDSRGSDGGRGGGGYGSRDAGFTPSRGSGPPLMTSSRPPLVVDGPAILPPRTDVGDGGAAAVSSDQLELRAKSMRKEWLQDPNEKELLMSINEVIASPDAGKIIFKVNIDYAVLDCKASELKPIIDMIVVLYKSKKVTDSDVMTVVGDVVEGIDGYACDNHHIYDDVGDIFSAFANENALTVQWLCECTSRISDESFKFKVIEGALRSVHKTFGDEAVSSCLTGKSERSALEKLLGPAKLQELEAMFG